MPQDWNYGTDRLRDATFVTRYGVEGFERYGLVTTVSFLRRGSPIKDIAGAKLYAPAKRRDGKDGR